MSVRLTVDAFETALARYGERLLAAEFITHPQYAQFALDDNGLTFGVKPSDEVPAMRVRLTVSVVAYEIALPTEQPTPTPADRAGGGEEGRP